MLTAVVLLAAYARTMVGMYDQWNTDEDMSHGLAVPFVIGWVIWRERDRWKTALVEPNPWGFAGLAAGALLHFAGAVGGGLFLSSAGFLVSAAGAILAIGGYPVLRLAAFPLLLSIFMLPKLAIVYNQATLPLQLLASRLAAFLLTTAGFGVIREGNILDVGGHQIAVAEACNGIRYLLSLGFMATVFAYVADPKPWMRAALLLAAVPISIGANAVRVAASGAVPLFAEGTPHMMVGWVIFAFCLVTVGVFHKGIDSVYSRFHAQP